MTYGRLYHILWPLNNLKNIKYEFLLKTHFQKHRINMVHNIDLTSNPKEVFWKLTTPFILLSLFEASYSFIDMFWVSQMAPDAFFAIRISVPLTALISHFGSSLGTGTNSIIARKIGQKDFEGAYNAILHGVLACALLGVIVFIASFFLGDILDFMNFTESVDLTIDYLTPLFLCSFVFLFSSLFVSALQAEGNSKTPTALLIISNVLNLILDPIFIFIFGWGVKGAAYSSIVSVLVILIYMVYWYLSGKSEVVLNFKYFKPGIVYDIWIVAIPNFIIDSIIYISVMFNNGILMTQLGQMGILLYSTANRIKSLIVTPQRAFGRSLLSISGQLFGAGKIHKLNEIYNYVVKISVIIALIFTILFFIVKDYGFALFSVTGVEESVFYIALIGILIVPMEEIAVMSARVVDGMGKSYYSLIITVLSIVTQIILISLLAPVLTSGLCVLVGIALTYTIVAAVYFVLIKIMFRRNEKNTSIN